VPAWGFDYAEIGARALVPFEDAGAFAAAKARLTESGTPIEALSGFVPASVPVIGPAVDWRQVRAYLDTTINRAAEIGVKVINWGSVQSRFVPPDWPLSRAWSQIEQVAGQITSLAEAAGVVVAIEAVNPREANVLFYLTEALQLAQTIGRPGLRVNVDYYHLVLQNEPLTHVQAVAGWIAHTHTSDDQRRLPGLGGWDQRPFFQALAEAGYAGRCSFEVRATSDPAFGEAARQSVWNLRALAASPK
jgi:D-psicose/D-tagatose/L-ribulose 3-epimerase